jgi:hypothetical protein
MHARLNAVRLILAALISPGLVAGCADSDPAARTAPTTPGQSAEQSTPSIRIVDEEADLTLYISNQSFADDPVHISVTIDGVELIDADFAVEGQHNWIDFPVELPGGEHEIVATSDTGVTRTETFTSSTTKQKYAVLDYWNYEDSDGKYFSWTLQGTPVAFG